MDDLERLFRHLVEVLTTNYPDRLNAALQISELYQSILPYRKYKKQLGFECNEDYEMAMLRLFAGESNYATVEPEEVKEQLMLEAQATNANPAAFRDFAAARVKLNESAIRSVQAATRSFAPPSPSLEQESGESEQWAKFAPPVPGPAEASQKKPVFEAVDQTTEGAAIPEPDPSESHASGLRCPNCAERLPEWRSVLFCPFCGYSLGLAACSSCGEQMEAGWRFCVSCGRRSSDA